MTSKKFDELYKKLNPEQKSAVDAIEGPVMVVAGPGTGKTQILTLRIANILRKTDTPPDAILALTFTDSGVYAMRKRLLEIVGSLSYRVHISTFHGFANDVIKNYPEAFPRIIGSHHIGRIDQIRIMEEVIRGAKLKVLKPYGDTFYYLHPALTAISHLKRENVGPKKLSDCIKKTERTLKKNEEFYHSKGPRKGEMKSAHRYLFKKIENDKELLLLYEKYQDALAKNKLYDYDDMIMEVIRVLETNRELLLVLQEEYHYILADEHQDANNAQNKILELLSGFHKNPNLFIVGDEKQAIFRFQGASLENFLYFKKHYPDAKLVNLETNYRSTQMILDSAHSLISKSGPPLGESRLSGTVSVKLRKKLIAASSLGKKSRKILFYAFSRPEVEHYFLAEDIAKKIKNGVLSHEIAVLYRDNKDAFPIRDAFLRKGIPFSIESDEDILEDEEMKKLIGLVKTLQDFGNDELLFRTLSLDFFHIPSLDVYKLSRYAWKKKVSVYEILREKKLLREAGVEDEAKLISLFNSFSAWAKMGANKNLTEFFEIVVRESGLLARLLAHESSIEKMEKLNTLFDEIKSLVEHNRDYTLRNFIEHLTMLDAHKILITQSKNAHRRGGVRLLTAHRSKGREFEYVYITGAHDTHWGNRRKVEHFYTPLRAEGRGVFGGTILGGGENDDERRLFYVAMTRAKREVRISYAKEGDGGKQQMPAQFISEIDPALVETVDVAHYESQAKDGQKERFAERPKRSGAQAQEKEFLNSLFFEQGFSVTALNNYLTCPWNYFYNNLVRYPKAPTKFQMYGIAVHETLKRFFDKYRRGETFENKTILNIFSGSLAKQPLRGEEFRELLEKGKKSLAGYFDFYLKRASQSEARPKTAHEMAWRRTIMNEFAVKGVFLAPQIRLTGKIDKIEILNEKNEVNVVDYKTSQPKSRAYIEGTTKNSGGDYKRQLAFYKILLDRYDNGKYAMVSGEIDFVEPEPRTGKYRKELFVIQKEEIRALEEEIKRVAGEILNLSFWDRRCDEKNCEFCRLRETMK